MASINSTRLLVLGGTGFIGHHLVREAMLKGWDVSSVSLHQPNKQRRVEGVHYLKMDLTNLAEVRAGLNIKFDYVVNLGGYIDHTLFNKGGRRIIEAHFNALQNIVEFLPRENLKRFVHIGSSDEYGNLSAPQREDSRESPISPYSLGKLAGTHFLQMLHKTENFPSTILRLFLTYGPGQDDKRFLTQIIKGCLKGSTFPASEGKQLRDFCFVEDTVKAIFLALRSDRANGEIFNVGSGIPLTIKSLINSIRLIIGKGQPQFGLIPYRTGENMALFANTAKIRDILGWVPNVSLEDGLRLTIDSIREDDV
jgi:nucleoside-diphosphate-sugar epimerase